jgi:hypothetical protein
MYMGKKTNRVALPPDHYIVHVTYAPMPPFAKLKKEFRGDVDETFRSRKWKLHSSCVGVTRTRGDKIFYVHYVGRDWEMEERIAWGLMRRTAIAPNGYRPATRQEWYEFHKAHPELENFVALGSYLGKSSVRIVPSIESGPSVGSEFARFYFASLYSKGERDLFLVGLCVEDGFFASEDILFVVK